MCRRALLGHGEAGQRVRDLRAPRQHREALELMRHACAHAHAQPRELTLLARETHSSQALEHCTVRYLSDRAPVLCEPMC